MWLEKALTGLFTVVSVAAITAGIRVGWTYNGAVLTCLAVALAGLFAGHWRVAARDERRRRWQRARRWHTRR